MKSVVIRLKTKKQQKRRLKPTNNKRIEIMLTGNEAKEFFKKATKDHKYRSQERRSGWFEEEDTIIAFDNSTGELFTEEFDIQQEAINYASGKQAITKHGVTVV